MTIIEKNFPSSTEEKSNFQFQAMTVIEDDSRAKMFLAVPSHRQKRWLEEKISSI